MSNIINARVTSGSHCIDALIGRKNLTNLDLSKGIHRVIYVRPSEVKGAITLQEIEENRRIEDENKSIVNRIVVSVFLTFFVLALEYGL